MASTNVLEVLSERGFVKDVSEADALRAVLHQPIAVYCGYDATAESYHVGNAVSMMMLAWFQRYGHRTIALMGGGTTMVGDPSGKAFERPILSPQEIAANLERLRPQIGAFIDFAKGAHMIDNSAWLGSLNLIDFLRDVGSQFTINRMLSHETYRLRLEEGGLTFLEFSYQLLQAYDFLQLYREYGCVLQIGGSDQWANILAGVELIRKVEQAQAFALVCPLITTAGGAKMGKTERGAVWLSSRLLRPYDYYQFWVNTNDADVERFLALFTFLPIDEVRSLGSLEGQELRKAKEILAFEATKILHGTQEAAGAREASHALFDGHGSIDAAPSKQYSRASLEAGVGIVDFVAEIGLLSSKREARRVIQQKGVSLNESTVESPQRVVTAADLGEDGSLLLRHGRKRYLIVKAL